MSEWSSAAVCVCLVLLIASAKAQDANDCWKVRVNWLERRPLGADEAGLFATKTDSEGNVFDFHYLNYQNPSLGFTCYKFSAIGSKLWESRFTNTWLSDFSAGPAGSLLVVSVAMSYDGGEHLQVWVTRLDAEGNRTWESGFNSRGFHHPVAIDSEANVFVGGVNLGASVNGIPVPTKDSPAAITKLDSSGEGLWCTHTNSVWPHETLPYSFTMGSNGDLYAAWHAYHEWSTEEPYHGQFVTMRLTTEGLERWSRRYSSPADNLMDPYSLRVDRAGNVFTTGSMFFGAPYDAHFTIKYSSEGTELWVVQWPDDSGVLEFGATALDDAGNLFITLPVPWEDRALLTAKYDPQGNRLWSIYEHVLERERYSLLDLRVDPAEAVIVSGLVHPWRTNESSRTKIAYVQNTTPGLPIIRRQPSSMRVRAGTMVSLGVLATGMEPIAFQWRLNGTNMTGETNATLVLRDIQTNESGSYSILVTNAIGCALSSEVALTVMHIPPFTLDHPKLTQTMVQEPDGSRVTNQWVEITMRGGAVGRLYTIEVSSNLLHWQSYVSRGVAPDGSALFIFHREMRGSKFYRASTWP